MSTQRRSERGSAAIWMLIIVPTAFAALIGLVGGGGELINEQVQARRVAEQAARAGADELSESSVRDGTDHVQSAAAIVRARDVLTASGWDGAVRVNGRHVTVTATGERHPKFLTLLGVGTVHIAETGAAEAISEDR